MTQNTTPLPQALREEIDRCRKLCDRTKAQCGPVGAFYVSAVMFDVKQACAALDGLEVVAMMRALGRLKNHQG